MPGLVAGANMGMRGRGKARKGSGWRGRGERMGITF